MSELRTIGDAAATAGPCLSIEVDQARDRAALISMGWAVSVLDRDDPNQAAEANRIAETHRPIVRRWIEELCRVEWLGGDDDPEWLVPPPGRQDVEKAWEEALALAPDPGSGGSLTKFFARCARALPELLTGEIQVQSLLFDENGTTTEIYQANEASRYTNAVAATAVRQRCLEVADEGRVPLVLEIGGGVGGTTDVVLDELTDLALNYHFTDVGGWFTNRALERWAGRAGLTSGFFDINAVEEEQHRALGEKIVGQVDAIVAANVMHNAADVPRALTALAALCRPGATLVLIETGTEHLPLLISMRFLMQLPPPGDGIGGERALQGRILLSSDQWSKVIDSGDWELNEVLPGPKDDTAVARYDQHVWLATCRDQNVPPHNSDERNNRQ